MSAPKRSTLKKNNVIARTVARGLIKKSAFLYVWHATPCDYEPGFLEARQFFFCKIKLINLCIIMTQFILTFDNYQLN